MSEDLFELETTYDRDDLAAVFEEIATALEAGRPIALETDEHRLTVAVPSRVEAEFELEREIEAEDDADREGDADGDNGDAPRPAELEFEIELEWEAPADDSGVTVEPRGDDGGRDAGDGEDPTGSAPAERDESEPDDGDSLLLPAEPSAGGGDAEAGDDGDSASRGRQSRFEVYRDRADQWRWRLVHWNGNIVADSGEGYASRSNAERAARGVMDTAPAARIERVEADG